MSTAANLSEVVRRVFMHPSGSVVALVDDLLRVCREHNLQLDWQADRCRVRSREGDWEPFMDVPLRRSVFRAMLARLGALCNEGTANAVSPYGGQGEFSSISNPPAICRVSFTNTPAEQKLQLTVEARPAAEPSTPDRRLSTAPLRDGATAG